jgi:hypothetical protein
MGKPPLSGILAFFRNRKTLLLLQLPIRWTLIFRVDLLRTSDLIGSERQRESTTRSILESEGKGHLFETLQGFLLGGEEASYQQVAHGLNLSLGALKTAIHRLRGRYRALLREEVARIVAAPAEVDEELRYLRAALRS